MKDTLKLIKELRDETKGGIMDCKKALEEAGNDLVKAKKILEKRGISKAAEKEERETNQGYIATYTHTTGKIGVVIEILCESDFVAKNEDFRFFAKELCLQLAAMGAKDAKALLKQEYIRDSAKTVSDLVKSTIAKFGENIKIGRIERFEI